jgi:hypothetical protein
VKTRPTFRARNSVSRNSKVVASTSLPRMNTFIAKLSISISPTLSISSFVTDTSRAERAARRKTASTRASNSSPPIGMVTQSSPPNSNAMTQS